MVNCYSSEISNTEIIFSAFILSAKWIKHFLMPIRQLYSKRVVGLTSFTKYLPLFLMFILSSVSYFANTLRVAVDGTQSYTTIQTAVNASANGDTVLVYPGRYIENVDYNGKNITIASLELITGNPVYRDSTIIDGNQNGSVVKSLTAINNATLFGFTITNGTGVNTYYLDGVQVQGGGGIALMYTEYIIISNCYIYNNMAFEGGGIYAYYSCAYIKNLIIRDNFAVAGGGIYLGINGQAIFDQNERVSVYNNTAGYVQDIHAASTTLYTDIYLDMGTLCPTTNYYIYYSKTSSNYPGGFPIININRGYRCEINHDIYVSPNGNDSNDCLSSLTPLKSIYKAIQIIYSDSLNPKTVYLDTGIYSSDQSQYFPIGLKNYVNIYGNPNNLPILVNNHYRYHFCGWETVEVNIKNIVCNYGNNPQGSHAIKIMKLKNVTFENIIINEVQSPLASGVALFTNSYYPSNYTINGLTINLHSTPGSSGLYNIGPDAIIKNLIINNCSSYGDESDHPVSPFYFSGNKLTLENSCIINNSISYYEYPVVSIGISHQTSDSRLVMNNVLIANNQSGGEYPVYIAAYTDTTSLISNCTFANNRGAYFATVINGNIQVSNCIFNNNTPAEILNERAYPNIVSHINFNNNFIRGYPNTVNSGTGNQIYFNEVVLTGDPGFCSYVADDYLSYRLGNSSICKDAGTVDTTGLYLPELDLYGNQRIYGSAIDLGCNEWNYPLTNFDYLIPSAMVVSTYPNPFTEEVNIRYNLDKAAKVDLRIYNLKGQLVKTLLNSQQSKGEHCVFWDACDERGRKISAGIYFLYLEKDGIRQAVKQLILVK